jgi:hypothetical protein
MGNIAGSILTVLKLADWVRVHPKTVYRKNALGILIYVKCEQVILPNGHDRKPVTNVDKFYIQLRKCEIKQT